MRLRKLQATAVPSIQGVWTPFTNRDPELNITKFPCVRINIFLYQLLFHFIIISLTLSVNIYFQAKFNHPANLPESATERLRAMFEKQKIQEELDEKLSDHVKIDVQS